MKIKNNTYKRGRVLLIYPPSSNKAERFHQPLSNFFENQSVPPIDLMYLASIAEKCGYKAKIGDYKQKEDLLAEINNFAPNFIVANIAMQTYKNDMEVLALIKSLKPAIKIIVKGIPFLSYNTNVTYENPFVDYVLIGEAEYTLKEILEEVKDSDILGICYTDENMQPVKNKPRPYMENLDEIPFPARHLINNSIYRGVIHGNSQAVIELSRGCPNNCFFCLENQISGSNIRKRTVENIILEIKECIDKYGIKDFVFNSHIFGNDKEWTIDLCKKLTDSGLRISWSAVISTEIDEETISSMREAGCNLVYLGVESGSEEILKNIGKNCTKDDIRNVIKILKDSKIKIFNHFIIGLPWETERTVEETMHFAIELNSDFVGFNIVPPFPGSRFFAYAMMNKHIISNLDYTNAYYMPIVKSHDLSKNRISELYQTTYKRYYLRPKFIFKTLFSIKSFTELKYYFNIISNILTKKSRIK